MIVSQEHERVKAEVEDAARPCSSGAPAPIVGPPVNLDYVKRLPSDGRHHVILFDARYQQVPRAQALASEAIGARLGEARGLAVSAGAVFAEIWRRAAGASALVALLVPSELLCHKELAAAPPPLGTWILDTAGPLGLGPQVVVSLEMLARKSPRAMERVRMLPASASYREFSAAGYRPARGDVWWEAEAGEHVSGYTFSSVDLEHRYYSCAESWASRFSTRHAGSEAWHDVFGAAPPAPKAPKVPKAPKAKPRTRKDEAVPARSAEAQLAIEGRCDELVARLGPTEALYAWLVVSASLGAVRSAEALASLAATVAAHWGDETIAGLYAQVARWFTFGEHGVPRDLALAREHLVRARHLDPSATDEELEALQRALDA